MSRPINYNDWFYKYHKYVSGNRDGLITYDDTKWKNINDRLLPLVESQSHLIDEQPFAVVGNDYGFDRLLNLMQESNYTFNNVTDALVESYRYNYKNAMSRMVVNTHAVICSFTNKDTKNVRYDSLSNYYIVDVPYDQMHFGERDEFIRQRLQKMHVKSTNVWVPLSDLNTIPIYREILEFSIMITMNGLVCNDCQVAFDDKGMMFRVRWKHSTDFKCIVYKLDTSNVYSFDLPIMYINGGSLNVPWNKIGNKHIKGDTVLNGIAVMYYTEFTSTLNVPGNICYIDDNGIHIPHIQNATSEMITNTNLDSIHLTIYELKYFFEIPNIYPAMNYYNMMEKNLVKDGNDDVGVYGDTVYANDGDVDYTVHISTPPIVIDRDSRKSYQLTMDVITDEDRMMSFVKTIEDIGVVLQQLTPNTPHSDINTKIVQPIEMVYPIIKTCREDYIKFAALTSMVDRKFINEFDSLYNDVYELWTYRNSSMLRNFQPDIFFGKNYESVVKKIYSVLKNKMFDTMRIFNTITYNFAKPTDATRFNRPVSEQCFIVMKYDIDDDVWLFDTPEIKHFNGIQNAFYINTGITGKEIFKFFVLYTDTESPSEKNIEPMSKETVFDFDKFCDEIHNHQSYIRYWSAENKLMKMSDVMFNQYDGATCVNILSKMMKHKISDELLVEYPSDINFEASGISTLGVGNESEMESPFTINYLFYTINLFYNKKDTFLSYFLYRLTHDNYSRRYIDINISDVLNDEHSTEVNYSYFNTSPDSISTQTSSLKNGENVYDGLPFVINGEGTIINNPYYYTFNDYTNRNYYVISENEIDENFYAGYDDNEYDSVEVHGCVKNKYNEDIDACRMITHYMGTTHDFISSILTNYEISFNQNKLLSVYIDDMRKFVSKMQPYLSNEHHYMNNDTRNLLTRLFAPTYGSTNMVYKVATELKDKLREITATTFNGRSISFFMFIQEFNGLIKRIHLNYGFKDFATPRARKLYIHLKKVNLTMNLHEFKQWVENIDYEFISDIENYIGNNTEYQPINFTPYKNKFSEFSTDLVQSIDDLVDLYIQLNNQYNIQFNNIRDYVFDIYNNYIFDIYKMNVDVEVQPLPNKPLYGIITLPTSDHTTNPVTGDIFDNVDLVFYMKYDNFNDACTIRKVYPICEYTFFDDTPIDTTMYVITEDGDEQLNVHITFTRVGSSADITDTIQMLNNINETKVDVQNIHERYTVVDNQIVNRKYADMHYELLIGNKFTQLTHTPELVLDRTTKLPGSIDRIYVDNQTINDFALEVYGNHQQPRMYFKPSQVLHLPIVDDVVTSVYGPYTVGQKIYLETYDYQYRFPVIITAIDHSQSRGFIEAKVDHSATWFELTDIVAIEDYLKNDITCHVIPDNISNFLNEYNNPDLLSYDLIELTDIPYEEKLYFPGDPIFVQNNADYVYTRINWILGDNVENRFIDDEHKQYQFKYIGEYQVYGDTENSFKVNMINHNVDPLTLSEIYPILRQEPDDHDVWDGEIAVFESRIEIAERDIIRYERDYETYRESMEQATTSYNKDYYIRKMDDCTLKIGYWRTYIERMRYYIRNLEKPSTWYNIGSYNAALVYIDNGRAEKVSNSFVECITDIPYTDDLELYMYDYENHMWIDPSEYSVTASVVDGVRFDNPDDFATNNVLHSIEVEFNSEVKTQKLLVYIGFHKSDMFTDIEINQPECEVRFKPLLSVNKNLDSDIYSDINVRKHFDGFEYYKYTEDNLPNDIDRADILEGFMVERPLQIGKYTNNPVYRFRDIIINNRPFTSYDFYIPMEFKDVNTIESSDVNTYSCDVNVEADSYQTDTLVTLICVEADEFNGNVSTISFEAMTGSDPSVQEFTIKRCNKLHMDNNTYVCTVLASSSAYKTCGGLITVTVLKSENPDLKCGNWVKLNDPKYHIVPDKFIVSCPNEGEFPYHLTIRNTYYNDLGKWLYPDNSQVDDPYQYYYDTEKNVRYPISDTRRSDRNKRLTINTNINPNIELIKAPYIGICRYSSDTIPEDGIIDMTGYVPTPLSRDRYEFWVNGRCIRDDKSLHILSPTSIQLCNLNSLRNFECIELVDDVYDSDLLPHGNVYIDLYGNYYHTNSYESFLQMMLNNRYIVDQRIDYMFYNLQHKPIYEYTKHIIKNPNNHDVEPNILDGLLLDETDDYRKFIHLPTINGVTLYNLSIKELGMREVSNNDILKLYNKVWRREAVVNPYIPLHHTSDILNIPVISYTKDETNDRYIIKVYGQYDGLFTIYISSSQTAGIDNVLYTKQIIPFVNCGTEIILEGIDKYQKKYVHTTAYSQPKKLN